MWACLFGDFPHSPTNCFTQFPFPPLFSHIFILILYFWLHFQTKLWLWGWCCLWKERGWCLTVLMWGWSLDCAPKLSQCHFRDSAWDPCGARAVLSHLLQHPEGILLVLGSCWQNPGRNQGWAVPGAAPSAACWEGWAEGFGVISCGFGVSWALHCGCRFLNSYRVGRSGDLDFNGAGKGKQG